MTGTGPRTTFRSRMSHASSRDRLTHAAAACPHGGGAGRALVVIGIATGTGVGFGGTGASDGAAAQDAVNASAAAAQATAFFMNTPVVTCVAGKTVRPRERLTEILVNLSRHRLVLVPMGKGGYDQG
ncbi:hypothetical protein GCM10009754_71740 [Amycolatopsis minnesotensis]|uniref:Uncharacterized protein n=1 Tax=Amycolatopsis minnesotensis TaxID=337894 RepID=A0ABN2SC47_9PSEU